MGSIAGMIDIREVPKLFRIMDEKILQHLLQCRDCRPGVRCIQYMSLKGIQDSLRTGSSNDQKN